MVAASGGNGRKAEARPHSDVLPLLAGSELPSGSPIPPRSGHVIFFDVSQVDGIVMAAPTVMFCCSSHRVRCPPRWGQAAVLNDDPVPHVCRSLGRLSSDRLSATGCRCGHWKKTGNLAGLLRHRRSFWIAPRKCRIKSPLVRETIRPADLVSAQPPLPDPSPSGAATRPTKSRSPAATRY